MKKGIVALILGMGIFISVFSQEMGKFEFSNNLKDTLNLKLDYSFAGNHFLGQQIANKFYRMEQTYTYVEKASPISPSDKIVVQKPVIFYAVQKINKLYKKKLKKGLITEQEAKKELGHILDVAYAIFNQNTEELEDYLRKNKKPEDIQSIFRDIELE